MIDQETQEVIEKTCQRFIEKLDENKKIKSDSLNSFSRTERLLRMYNYLDEDSKEKELIENALDKIKNDDYYGIIEERYFNNLTFEQIADIYNVKTQTISRNRKRLVRVLAKCIFPNEVVEEILKG